MHVDQWGYHLILCLFPDLHWGLELLLFWFVFFTGVLKAFNQFLLCEFLEGIGLAKVIYVGVISGSDLDGIKLGR